jgi:hypothetical protein
VAAATALVAALAMAMPEGLAARATPGAAPAALAPSPPRSPPRAPALGDDDLAYLRHRLAELRRRGTSAMVAWADTVEDRLLAAARGEIDRLTLLAEIDALGEPSDAVGAADILEGIRQATPSGPTTRPEPPPSPDPVPPPGPDRDPDPGAGPVGPGADLGPAGPGDPDHAATLTGHDPGTAPGGPVAGPTTATSGTAHDEHLTGAQGRGPSRRATILSASRKGFASVEYRRVFTQYLDIVEEVLHTEKVPTPHRHVIQRYFHRIRPTD